MNLDKLVGKQVYYVLASKERTFQENRGLPLIHQGILNKEEGGYYPWFITPGPSRQGKWWLMDPEHQVSLNKFELLVKVKLGWL